MSSKLFNLVVNNPVAHLPAVPFNGIRLWDTEATWEDLNPSRGIFNWAALDAQLTAAAKAGKEVLYTFGKVPVWANAATNSAVPPTDIDSGNDIFKRFVVELIFHSLASPEPIAAYEVWNEPNLQQYWAGSQAQLITMAQDVYNLVRALDPAALVVGPACDGGGLVKQWLLQYYLAGGPSDVLNFHGYLDDYKTIPSSLSGLLNDIALKKSAAEAILPNKPIWFTEGSWGKMANYATALTPDQQVAYLAQWCLILWLAGVERLYWYAWDNTSGWGTLWTVTGGANLAGIAYGVLAGWLTGAISTGPSATNANGTITVPLALASGVNAQVVYHPTQTHSLSTKALTYQALDGNTYSVKNGSVTVGPKPILLIFV